MDRRLAGLSVEDEERHGIFSAERRACSCIEVAYGENAQGDVLPSEDTCPPPGCLHRLASSAASGWHVQASGLSEDKDVRLMKRLDGRAVA